MPVSTMSSSQDYLSELRSFIAGTSRVSSKTNPLELARTALSLLQTFPATRDAVLEYFCTLFDSAVNKYVKQIETDADTNSASAVSSHEDATIAEIHNVLCSFVKANPEAWAPIISTWSLELLGELSSRYAGRARMSASLNETLQLWMSCRATHTLIDITTQCLSCLMHFDTEACINALLDTSVSHSPHFDWVVAHVGSCFPNTVITRVLSCGLKDFSQHGAAEQGVKSPKLNSVVGILGHLAGSHFVDIRMALLELFKLSLDSASIEDRQREATVPFLLQLASLSSTLLRALTSDVLQTLTPAMLPQLSKLAPVWCLYFGGAQALEDLIVHLALGCEQGGAQIIELLLETAAPPSRGGTVQSTSREILELLLQEIDQMLRCSAGSVSIPLLGCVKKEISVIQPLLLSSDPLRLHTAVRLLGLLGYHSPAVLISSASFLLQHATTDNHLAALVRLVTSGNPTASVFNQVPFHKSDCMTQALEQAIRSITCPELTEHGSRIVPERLWINVATLLRWEKLGQVMALRGNPVSSAMCANLREASILLSSSPHPTLAHAVANAIDLVPIGQLSIQLTLQLTKAVIDYFFLCIRETESHARIRGVNVCYRLFSRLSSYKPAARSQALGELVQRALFGREARHFGATVKAEVQKPKEVKLIDEIQKLGTSSMLAHRLSSVFLSGSLDVRHSKLAAADCLPDEVVGHNTQLLLDAIKACATDLSGNDGYVVSLDAITMLSLTVVQLISTDVMYNGLPWPDEEFCKVTVERDLQIRRIFDDLPLTWQILRLVAAHRPCLCYCSVLLRALAATLLAQWSTAGRHKDERLLRTTQGLLELMALGQLLPHPLSSMRDVIPTLKPVEIMHLLRACVWNYMRDNVPSPALFTRDDTGRMWRDSSLPSSKPARQHTDTLRFIMQNNIEQLGTFYSQLFVNNNNDE